MLNIKKLIQIFIHDKSPKSEDFNSARWSGFRLLSSFLLIAVLAVSCAAPSATDSDQNPPQQPAATQEIEAPTPFPTRPVYSPGELVDYKAQTGDTLPVLAIHFNTTEKEIREANPIIPEKVTTLPPGLPMKIPIYYQTLWGSPFQIIPDDLFVNSPAQSDFNTAQFVDSHPGWLKSYVAYAGNQNRRGGEVIDYVAINFSISPRLLLALIEYQTGALSQPGNAEAGERYSLGIQDRTHIGLYQQLISAANTLNNGYYAWRSGQLTSFEHTDGSLERPDPWQNAASVALQYFFAQILPPEDYYTATHSQGLARTYQELFGTINWSPTEPLIPGSLEQPPMKLPFESGKAWAFTGGPHTGWGLGLPFSAIDFAPPSVVGGCSPTTEYATAVADGVIARKEPAIAVLDLDGDGNERTGWVVFYLHLQTTSIPPAGTSLKQGDPIGFPSCEGGRSTGTHVHIARKYNGEWIMAGGALAFNLEGWIAEYGNDAYLGDMVNFSRSVRACVCSDQASQIQSGSTLK